MHGRSVRRLKRGGILKSLPHIGDAAIAKARCLLECGAIPILPPKSPRHRCPLAILDWQSWSGLQSLLGGNITLYTKLCGQTRSDAFEQMQQHAVQLGANAVIGMRYDATEIAAGITEVLCYGTAVTAQPVQ